MTEERICEVCKQPIPDNQPAITLQTVLGDPETSNVREKPDYYHPDCIRKIKDDLALLTEERKRLDEVLLIS